MMEYNIKMYLCPRCHESHGPPEICGVSSKYCSKCTGEMEEYTFKIKCFEVIYNAMLSAGGDGASVLCCDKWKETAVEFEKWLNDNHPNFLKRSHENDHSVTFSDNQESVTIAQFDFESNPKNWTECYLRTLLF